MEINSPDVDPSRGLTELPTSPVDATNQIARGCAAGRAASEAIGEFVVTGRGGLPANPSEVLDQEAVAAPWVESPANQTGTAAIDPPPLPPPPLPTVEATSWTIDTAGKITLVAPTASQVVAGVDCPI
ncbi:MAG: S-layer family protein [Leptolyngbyaceae cyanobacterium SL_7_1]|nr:S-layer family protein [Leptolyngbyaceae cyanobacterium SL_7_1]